jgi:hypothetical protein
MKSAKKNSDHVNEHFRRNSRMKFLKKRVRECVAEIKEIERIDDIGRY